MTLRRNLSRSLLLFVVPAMCLFTGCAPGAEGDDPSLDTDVEALSSPYFWNLNGFVANGTAHTITSTLNLPGGGSFVVSFNSALIGSPANTMSLQGISFTYTKNGTTVSGTNNRSSLTTGTPVSVGVAGKFLSTITLVGNNGNYTLAITNPQVTVGGSTIHLADSTPGLIATSSSATSVTILGAREVGQAVTGSYAFADTRGNAEQGTTFQWYLGPNAISGATSASHTLAHNEVNKQLRFCVRARNAYTLNSNPAESCASIYVPQVIMHRGSDGTGASAQFVAVSGCQPLSDDETRWNSFTVNPPESGAPTIVTYSGGVCGGSTGAVTVIKIYADDRAVAVYDAATLIANNEFTQLANNTILDNPSIVTAASLVVDYTWGTSPQIQYVVEGNTMTITP